MKELPKIDAFLKEVAAGIGWNKTSTMRLRSAGEETLSSLLQPGNDYANEDSIGKTPSLHILARPEAGAVELEFVAVVEGEENLEDRLAYLDDQEEMVDDREVSFRLLRYYAATVKHQKYQGIDIVTVKVEPESLSHR